MIKNYKIYNKEISINFHGINLSVDFEAEFSVDLENATLTEPSNLIFKNCTITDWTLVGDDIDIDYNEGGHNAEIEIEKKILDYVKNEYDTFSLIENEI